MGWIFAVLGIASGLLIGVFGFWGEYVTGASIFIPLSIIGGGIIHQLCKIRRALEHRDKTDRP